MIETNVTNVGTEEFRFKLADLAGWIIRKKDGTVFKYVFGQNGSIGKPVSASLPAHYQTQPSLSAYCQHDPAKVPIFSQDGVSLFIADSTGAKAHYKEFDAVIDGGSVIYPFKPDRPVDGDAEYANLLNTYASEVPATRIIKITWIDRAAPPLLPGAWPALAQTLKGNILTCCQGGHGRSGTSLVALMMCLSDYTPKEAIIHLRAAHCPRAIESKVQHDYLNDLAAFLGRPEDAHEAEQVKDYKAAFLTMTQPWGDEQRARLKGTK